MCEIIVRAIWQEVATSFGSIIRTYDPLLLCSAQCLMYQLPTIVVLIETSQDDSLRMRRELRMMERCGRVERSRRTQTEMVTFEAPRMALRDNHRLENGARLRVMRSSIIRSRLLRLTSKTCICNCDRPLEKNRETFTVKNMNPTHHSLVARYNSCLHPPRVKVKRRKAWRFSYGGVSWRECKSLDSRRTHATSTIIVPDDINICSWKLWTSITICSCRSRLSPSFYATSVWC